MCSCYSIALAFDVAGVVAFVVGGLCAVAVGVDFVAASDGLVVGDPDAVGGCANGFAVDAVAAAVIVIVRFCV